MHQKLSFLYTLLGLVVFQILCHTLQAQEQGISYQAIIRDENGTILQNQNVMLEFEIIRNQASGPVEFTETVTTMTDEFGLVNLVIGQQNRVQFNQINWGDDTYFLKVSLNGTQIGGIRQFQAVPYSKIATNMVLDNLRDVQSAAAVDGNVLVFQSGNWQPGDVETLSFTAGDGIDITGNIITNTAPDQTVTLTAGNNVAIGGAYPDFTISATDNVEDDDADPSNELQTLSFDRNNNTLSISEGNSVTIPTGGTDADSDPTNEIQVLSKSGNVVTLSREGGSFTDEVNDNDSDPSNEFQTLSIQSNQLSISNGNTVTLPTGSGNSLWTANGNNIYYNKGTVGIGTDSPDGNVSLHIIGNESDGTRGVLKLTNTARDDEMILGGNEIDALLDDLDLNQNSSQNVTMVQGGGSVVIGKKDPVNGVNIGGRQYIPTGAVLDVNRPAFIEGNVFIRHNFGSGDFGLSLSNEQLPDRIWTLHVAANNPVGPIDGALIFLYQGGGKARILTDGTYVQLSDARAKTNILPFTGVLSRALQLQLAHYSFKSTGTSQMGYLAQEVQAIFPELVSYDPVEDKYFLNYNGFGPIAIEAVKEQQQMIISQKKQIEDLEGRIKRLEELLIKGKSKSK